MAYEVVTTTSKQRATSQVASELKGASVGMSSSAHLQVNGSKVQATAGDLDVQAREVTLGATRNDRDLATSATESGGGLTVTGGIDRWAVCSKAITTARCKPNAKQGAAQRVAGQRRSEIAQ